MGLALVPYYVLMTSSAASGHGSFSIFSLEGMLPAFLFLLLLVSRVLFKKSPTWLWLGSPTILAILGAIGFLVYAELFLIPHF